MLSKGYSSRVHTREALECPYKVYISSNILVSSQDIIERRYCFYMLPLMYVAIAPPPTKPKKQTTQILA